MQINGVEIGVGQVLSGVMCDTSDSTGKMVMVVAKIAVVGGGSGGGDIVIGDDSTDPLLRLDGHCNTTANGCAALSSDICHCQNLGIKVILSIEAYSLESKSHAKNVSEYLWNNYLGGNSSSRPFGNVVLNAPECPFPDVFLGDALNTGLFDYVWVHFYNLYAGKLPCQYNNNTSGGNIHALLDSWKVWIRSTKGDVKVFMGLLALTEDVLSGFIPAEVLKGQILPEINKSSKYGGVMLWTLLWDNQSGYSDSIKGSV
ncbi:Acidic endochitinase [Camellia lanceoleosa]|uniref:Acidic endochitinase n=1 Tax=Camellia lanceoleosa TaxID=1840588 RepID=A0ACC0F9D7_9ERIC|nr:Acidic endochitinase [Camellia lanceoleosa]